MNPSKFQVVALGELQQPGGVGATHDYNPVVDGPNPDANLLDNAGNSPEQEAANETWVNIAVDMLNRGEPDEVIIAKLAHDGCPHPESFLARAKSQPQQQPVGDSIGQDPFETPPPDQPTGEMQGLSQQPPTLAHIDVRIEGKDWSKWAAENLPGTDPTGHPVREIEKFIASLPEVEPTRPELREAGVRVARRAIRGILSKTNYADAQKLAALDQLLDAEARGLAEYRSNLYLYDEERERHVAGGQFEYNAYKIATPQVGAFKGNVKEAALIWASESPYHAGTRRDDFTFAVFAAAEKLGLSAEQTGEFLTTAQDALQHRHVRTEEFTAETPDNEGPAEELFT